MAEMGIYILSSLLGAGALLSHQRPAITTHKQPTVGTDAYNSTDHQNHQEQERRMVQANWKAAQHPVESGVIPMYFNTLNVAGDSEKIPNKDYQSHLIYNVIKGLDLGALNQSAKPEWGVVMDRPVQSSSPSDPLAQIGGSLHPHKADFTHNNMVPFHRGGVTQDVRQDSRDKEGKLELYTGQFKLNHQQKQEQAPLFAPVTGLTNIYGHHEQRDITRYNPNNTGKKHGELPFEQTRVGPGLNQGYTATPSGGYHQTLRIMPKSIEHLRVDPVLESEGRIKAGKSHVDKRALVAHMHRNRPELLVENKNGERNFTTVGAVTGRRLRPHVLLRHTHRKKSKMLIAPAKAVGAEGHRVAPKTRKSSRQNYRNTPFRNATDAKKHGDYGKSGIRNRVTNRSVIGGKTHILAPTMAGGSTKHKTQLHDKARKTRKQHYTHNRRIYGHTGIQKPGAAPAYNPADWVAKTTVRETTEHHNHIGGAAASASGFAGLAYQPGDWTARTTVRQTTENHDYLGGYSGGDHKNRVYTVDPARTTVRETTENHDHVGVVSSLHKKHIAYDPTVQARTTVRETTENNDYLGHHSGIHKRHIVVVNDTAKTTIKETTEIRDHLGAATGQRKHKNGPEDRARTTIRETTEKRDHLGVATGHRKHKNGPEDRARTTIRETTEKRDHLGVATGQRKHKNGPEDRARTTIKETTEIRDHLGAATGQKKHKNGPEDRARTTIKETTEIRDHLGAATGQQSQSGKGYTATNVEAKNTNRQFTSDHEYTGVANASSKKTTCYDNAYNARTNDNKERIALGRQPMGGGPRLGHQEINIDVKKMDEDRINQYASVKTSNIANMYNPDSVTLTSERNYLPQHDTRLDPDLLDAYRSNPLALKLGSIG